MADCPCENVYINNDETGDVPNCGILRYQETGLTGNPYWMIAKRGSEYSGQEDHLVFSYQDGTNWHQLLNLDLTMTTFYSV